MTYQVKNRFQSLPFKCNLQRYTVGLDPAYAKGHLRLAKAWVVRSC
jgi:hypothetical protein